MLRLLLPLMLCLAGCAVPAPRLDPPAAALHWTVETASGRFLGSATVVGPGRLVTNQHVVGNFTALAVSRNGERLLVRRITAAEDIDAALLEVRPITGMDAAPLGPLPAPGEVLTVAGARGGRRQWGSGVADPARFGPTYAAAWLPAAPGYSGGPVLDASGRLVGIITAAVESGAPGARALSSAGMDRAVTPRLVVYLPIAKVLKAVGLPP